MRSRTFLSIALAIISLGIPLAAHAAFPFFGPIIDPNVLDPRCALGWGAVMIVINNIISFLITLAIVFVAPLMIAYSGFLFVVNPVNSSGIAKAKSILTHTIVGIVIALAGWLIVDVIMVVLYNKGADGFGETWQALVNWDGKKCIPLPATLSQVTPTAPPPGIEIPPVISTDEQSVRDLLGKYGIEVNKSPCTAEQMTGPKCGTSPGPSCTNVAGMKPATVQQIINIANACGDRPGSNSCGVVVTGGTEPGHACDTYSHENGYKVDLRQTAGLNTYLETFSLTGRRGGHFSGDIRSDRCANEYVKETSPTIWDITIKTLCGSTTTNPPPGGGDRRTNWPPSTIVLDSTQIQWTPFRLANVQNGAENIFAYDVPAGITKYEVKVAEMPGTPSGMNHITVYSPDGYIIAGPQQAMPAFFNLEVNNPAVGLHHIVVVQVWDPTPENPEVGAFILQIPRRTQ